MNNSMALPPEFTDGAVRSVSGKRLKMAAVDTQRAASPGLDCVSIGSSNSMPLPPEFSDGYLVRSDSGVNCGEEPRVASKLQKYACDLTLDPNTANTLLVLSEGNKKVTSVRRRQSYPDHPDRFDGYLQVVSKESLTGRCYWEAQWSGPYAEISVCYKGIKRKGWSYDCWFGHNNKSWSLRCSNHSFTVWHNDKAKVISLSPDSSRTVGVFVDESSGSLSFYSVSDTHKLKRLHTFHTTFTDTLYAGFIVSPNSSVSLRPIKYTRKNKKNTRTHSCFIHIKTHPVHTRTVTQTHRPNRLASTHKHNAYTYTHQQTHMHRHTLRTTHSHSTYTNPTPHAHTVTHLFTHLLSVATLCCCSFLALLYLLFKLNT
ncbi:stonustoxin subunit beta-like [Danio aesculapii]|uniref:stonustoxin subunit beta-like n=1 Tax=Danio aesculapii TaxID=1142201 RepID=UPI0024C07AC8|nr:stonustoxin subunit beta-like [Danio aesculapii]